MYIRRKVFSLLQDENGEERYFSTTEFTDERLYAEKEEKEDSTGKKIAKGAGIGAGATLVAAGGYQGIHAIRRHMADEAKKKAKEGPEIEKAQARRGKIENEAVAKAGRNVDNRVKGAVNTAVDKTKEVAQNVGKKTKETAVKAKDATVEAGKKTGNFIKRAWKGGKAREIAEEYKAGIESKGLRGAAKKAAEEKLAKYETKAKRAGVRNKALMIGTPVVLTAGGVAAKKVAKNRKEKSED